MHLTVNKHSKIKNIFFFGKYVFYLINADTFELSLYLNILLKFMMLIIIFMFLSNEEQFTSNATITLKPGEYLFHVYGAQGGDGYKNGNKVYDGGKGSYASGYIHFSKKTTLKIIVGTKGLSGKNGTKGEGGKPDGGYGGKDTGWSGFDNDFAGGGGGSSQVIDSSSSEKNIYCRCWRWFIRFLSWLWWWDFKLFVLLLF